MESKLNKKYTPGYKKFRRVWVNLFRPIVQDSKNLFLLIDPIAYIMFTLFLTTFLLYFYDIAPDNHWIPFASGFAFTAISMLYFRLFPLTWDEMSDVEKQVYRMSLQLPRDWEPTENKI